MQTCFSEHRTLVFACLLVASSGCKRLEPSEAEMPDGGQQGTTYVPSMSQSEASNQGASSSSSSASSTAQGGSGSSEQEAGGESLSRGPTPADGGTNFPFPQNRQASGCSYPSAYSNDAVVAAYAKWKADLVTTDNADGYTRVQRTSTDGVDGCRPLNSTVSEGIGYGMLLAVYMDDASLFDNLWLYEQKNLDGNGLMNWAPNGGSGPSCSGAATDADEDMAFALVIADRQWGGQGTLQQSYKQLAITQIQKIWSTEIYNYAWVRAGDGNWATSGNQNISYFAPSYYRVFAQVDPNSCPRDSDAGYAQSKNCDGWWGVIDQSYTTLSDSLNSANGNQSNGVVPGWCNDGSGAPCTAASGEPFYYQYDACRTPFRIGLDWCFNGEPRAAAYLAQISSFFSTIGAVNIVDGYNLNGTPNPGTPAPDAGVRAPLSDPFVGPAAVGAMSSSSYPSLLNDAYGLVAPDHVFAGGEYYASSWRVLSLLMLTGNFLDYTQQTPVN